MSHDQPSYVQTQTTSSPPRLQLAFEHAWTLWKSGRRTDCGLYFHRESNGWAVHLHDNGFLRFGQRFIVKDAALRLAGELRHDFERDGWTPTVEETELIGEARQSVRPINGR